MEAVSYEQLPETEATGAYRVSAVGRGEVRMDVAKQWANRPDDQKFCSLDAMRQFVTAEAENSFEVTFESKELTVRDVDDDIEVYIGDKPAKLTNWTFGQLCQQAQAPSHYLASLPASIATLNLTYGLAQRSQSKTMAYMKKNGDTTLRALTSEKYGRILDRDVVRAVQEIAGNGTGDRRWKVPGSLDWRTGAYDPFTPVTKQTTTLYASDRDVFMFLVDDTHPIEIGKLENGDPDLLFRGFYVYNSEVGARTLGIATMYLRAVCCNRILWGVEGFQEMRLRHSKLAPDKYLAEAQPALLSFSNAATSRLLAGIEDARRAVIGTKDDEQVAWLRGRGFSKTESEKILKTFENEEHRPVRSVWDVATSIAAMAREVPYQDQRVAMERKAERLLEAV